MIGIHGQGSTYKNIDGSTRLQYIQIDSINSNAHHAIFDLISRRAAVGAAWVTLRAVGRQQTMMAGRRQARRHQLIFTVHGQHQQRLQTSHQVMDLINPAINDIKWPNKVHSSQEKVSNFTHALATFYIKHLLAF